MPSSDDLHGLLTHLGAPFGHLRGYLWVATSPSLGSLQLQCKKPDPGIQKRGRLAEAHEEKTQNMADRHLDSCFYKLGVHFLGALVSKGPTVFGVYMKASDFWKQPDAAPKGSLL